MKKSNVLLKEIKTCEKVYFHSKIVVIQEYMQYIKYKVKIFTNDQLDIVATCPNLYGEISSSIQSISCALKRLY
jgi:hypothetical protein